MFYVSSSTFSGRNIKELVSPGVRCDCRVHREAVGEPVGVRQPRAPTCPEVGKRDGTFALRKVAQFAWARQ